MNSIAIITARGGSKRIPKKNIKEFCGKPIIAYSIEAALESNAFAEVMVSTDSEEIASIAKQYGAVIPFMRSPTTSNDFATTSEVIAEVIAGYAAIDKKFDAFCCLYPTAPFVSAQKLRAAFDFFEKSRCDSLISVVKYAFPPQRALLIDGGRVRYQFPENAAKRSQDLPPIYHDCGQFYICKTSMFMKSHALVSDQTVPFIVPEEEAQDIDTMSDWLIAEAKYKILKGW